jgi:hypothetical protein
LASRSSPPRIGALPIPLSLSCRRDRHRAQDRYLDEAASRIEEPGGTEQVPDHLLAVGCHQLDRALAVGAPQAVHQAGHHPPVIAEGSQVKVGHGDMIIGVLRP